MLDARIPLQLNFENDCSFRFGSGLLGNSLAMGTRLRRKQKPRVDGPLVHVKKEPAAPDLDPAAVVAKRRRIIFHSAEEKQCARRWMESSPPFRYAKGRGKYVKVVAEVVAAAEEDLARAVDEESEDEGKPAVAEALELPAEDEPLQPMLHPAFVVQELVQQFSTCMSDFEGRFYNADIKKTTQR